MRPYPSIGQDQPISVLVVIVCYRAVELTIECLRSLRSEIAAIPGAKVAVCENGTGPEAVHRLSRALRQEGCQDWVSLKVIEPNCGFTGGNNAILRDAMRWRYPPEYFLLLNADTIVRPGAIRQLLAAMRARPDVGIVGPRLEHPDGEPQISCFRAPTPVSEFLEAARTGPLTRLLAGYEVPLAAADTSIEPDWISFACALIRREVVEQVGYLDEGYYLYYDDPDYCRRARRAGWGILYCPQARVVHLIGQSNPVVSLTMARRRRPRYYYGSRSRYFAKCYGMPGLWLTNLMWMAGRSVSLFREIVGRKRPHTCDREWRDIWTNALRPDVDWGFPTLSSEWLRLWPPQPVSVDQPS
ncbi:MAG TPA: glycosyltransferase family 2 protein [Phycisphaerae bacterium]|nr:glycosyltransferase family 2 protein [Phycisphaerae bacterium]